MDSTVYVEYVGGEGRGGGFENGSGLTLLRWQRNPQGEVLAFSQADLKRREKLVSGVTLAGVVGDSPFTRFTGSGGSQLPAAFINVQRNSGWGDARIRLAHLPSWACLLFCLSPVYP